MVIECLNQNFAHCLEPLCDLRAGRAAAVFFVAAGEVSTFRSIEHMLLPAAILATPVHVADLLQPVA